MSYERDRLREICIDAQSGICMVCGKGLYGDAQVNEAIIKRGDLPNDSRIFTPLNCVALHAVCHKNTKAVDLACIDFLVWFYGAEKLQDFIEGLEMKELPGRAREIMNLTVIPATKCN